MAKDSLISWTKHTFNPWRGCSKVHEGCTHCYAEKAMPNVMRKGGPLKWGEVWQGGERVVASEAMWKEPLRWARAAATAGERHRVFCASLADVLEVPADAPPSMHPTLRAERQKAVENTREALEWARQKLWNVIRETAVRSWPLGEEVPAAERPSAIQEARWPGLDWLLLTKRPENWRLVPEDVRPLVWLGTSVSSQETVEEWVPRLLHAEGFRYRFLSVEPLVGPIRRAMPWTPCRTCDGSTSMPVDGGGKPCVACLPHQGSEKPIDWLIIGGESGGKARPCSVEWIRSIIQQCAEARVPCFVKQLGADPREPYGRLDATPMPLKDPKGADMAEWPEDLRVRQFPEGVLP